MELGADTKLFMRRLVEAQTELFCFVSALLPFNRSDVDDVVQETNRALIEHAGDYDEARPFLPWMLAFAKNQIRCFRKRHGADRLIFDDELIAKSEQAFAEEAEGASASPQSRRLALCLAKLTARQRKLVALRYDAELSMEEIARKMGLRNPAVRASLFYIRRKLADCMTRLCRTTGDEAEDVPLSVFEDALAGVVDGEAVPSDRAESVVRRLKTSDESLRTYLAQMRVHALLSRRRLPGICGLPQRPAAVRAPRWQALATAAAAAALAVGVGFWRLGAWPRPGGSVRQTVEVEAVEDVDDWLASLTPLDRQAYEENMGFHALRKEAEKIQKYEPGSLMNPGIGIEILALSAPLEKKLVLIAGDYVRRSRLTLDGGSIKFRLDSGAVVTFFGPGEIELKDGQVLLLHGGMAVVENGGNDLCVAVPGATLRNQTGTAFCADLSEKGMADVVVLSGTLQLVSAEDGWARHLSVGEGVRLTAGQGPVRFRCRDVGDGLKQKFLSGHSKIAMQKRRCS